MARWGLTWVSAWARRWELTGAASVLGRDGGEAVCELGPADRGIAGCTGRRFIGPRVSLPADVAFLQIGGNALHQDKGSTCWIVVVWNRTPLSEGRPCAMPGHLPQRAVALSTWRHVLGRSGVFWFGFGQVAHVF